MLNLLYKKSLTRVTTHTTKIACYLTTSILKHNNNNNNNNKISLFSTNSTNENNSSVTVSHLVNTCNLSHETALHVSKHVVNLKDNDYTHKSHQQVLSFLKSHHFSDTQISRLVKACPRLLTVVPETYILPKFQFLESKGISKSDLCTIVSSTPTILQRSLDGYIMPTFDFYKNLFKSDEKVIATMKRYHRFLLCTPETVVAPRLDVLRSYGVPESSIAKLVAELPRLALVKSDTLKKKMEEVKEMGFDPQRMLFILAFKAVLCVGRDTWENRVQVYRKWGWSEETFIVAFRRFPNCIRLSNKKITAVMDHFVNKLGCESIVLAMRPSVLGLSLENRIIPRTSVLQYLRDKGLRRKSSSWTVPLLLPELKFLEKYVYPFEQHTPQLLKLYRLLPSVTS